MSGAVIEVVLCFLVLLAGMGGGVVVALVWLRTQRETLREIIRADLSALQIANQLSADLCVAREQMRQAAFDALNHSRPPT